MEAIETPIRGREPDLPKGGISAHLAVRDRGQAPQPRSGASKTPGLRSATHRQTIKLAARSLLHLTMSDRSSADLYREVEFFRAPPHRSGCADVGGNRLSISPALRTQRLCGEFYLLHH